MIRKERIGIFGGTFNPIHSGHVRAAAEVRARFALDRVLFVPSFIPPHKETAEVASPRDRMAMVELALRRHRRLVASPVEIEAGGTSYSIMTLSKIGALHPGARIFFILGADAFRDIETWRDWRRVLAGCRFIVTTRPGSRLAEARDALAEEYRSGVLGVRPSTRLGEAVLEAFRIFLTPIDAVDVSSTEVRARVRAGRPLRGLVPASVERYIREHGLYRDPTS
jgi:nicotinate-nucleotide adenylyltransferase